MILGQNHSALSQSPAITSSLDHDARALYKIIISTFFTKNLFKQTSEQLLGWSIHRDWARLESSVNLWSFRGTHNSRSFIPLLVDVFLPPSQAPLLFPPRDAAFSHWHLADGQQPAVFHASNSEVLFFLRFFFICLFGGFFGVVFVCLGFFWCGFNTQNGWKRIKRGARIFYSSLLLLWDLRIWVESGFFLAELWLWRWLRYTVDDCFCSFSYFFIKSDCVIKVLFRGTFQT